MSTTKNEEHDELLDAQIAYWALPYALTSTIERILTVSPIKRGTYGYFIDFGNQSQFLHPYDLEEYLQWLEQAYPSNAKKIRERVKEADEHWFGRNYEAM